MTSPPASRAGVRPGDETLELPEAFDASLYYIGRIRTPFPTLADCPKNPGKGQVEARVELDQRFPPGLEGLKGCTHLILLYWMDAARRDLIRLHPSHVPAPRGVFALRSPSRPNPIALSVVELLGIDGATIRIKGIDCRDGTPLLDIKPYLATIDSVPGARRP